MLEAQDLSANPHVIRGVEQEDDARNLMEQAQAYQLAFVQVQFQILIADAAKGWLCFYHKGLPLLPVCIARDECLVRQLQQEAEAFWQCVEEGHEPEKDPEKDVFIPQGLMEQAQWYKLAMIYRSRQMQLNRLKEKLETGKSQQKQLQQALQQLMGEFRVAESDGLRICRSGCNGSVDYQKALEALCEQHQLAVPDLKPFRRNGREQLRVTLLDDSESEWEMAGNTLLGVNPAVSHQSFYF